MEGKTSFPKRLK